MNTLIFYFVCVTGVGFVFGCFYFSIFYTRISLVYSGCYAYIAIYLPYSYFYIFYIYGFLRLFVYLYNDGWVGLRMLKSSSYSLPSSLSLNNESTVSTRFSFTHLLILWLLPNKKIYYKKTSKFIHILEKQL